VRLTTDLHDLPGRTDPVLVGATDDEGQILIFSDESATPGEYEVTVIGTAVDDQGQELTTIPRAELPLKLKVRPPEKELRLTPVGLISDVVGLGETAVFEVQLQRTHYDKDVRLMIAGGTPPVIPAFDPDVAPVGVH
jgi:hypothetical protein